MLNTKVFFDNALQLKEYPSGHFGDWINNSDASKNRFFPVAGNHDYENATKGLEFETALYDNWAQYFPTEHYVNFSGSGTDYKYYDAIKSLTGITGHAQDDNSDYGGRFYTFKKGNIRFFAVSTMYDTKGSAGTLEPYGTEYHPKYHPTKNPDVDANGTPDHTKYAQAYWLQEALRRSVLEGDKYQVVYMHYAPVSTSNPAQVTKNIREWPLKSWGVDLVVSGDDHYFQHWTWDGLDYIVNGTGGHPVLKYDEVAIDPGYTDDELPLGAKLKKGIYGRYGAILVKEEKDHLKVTYTYLKESDTFLPYNAQGNYTIANSYTVDGSYTVKIASNEIEPDSYTKATKSPPAGSSTHSLKVVHLLTGFKDGPTPPTPPVTIGQSELYLGAVLTTLGVAAGYKNCPLKKYKKLRGASVVGGIGVFSKGVYDLNKGK